MAFAAQVKDHAVTQHSTIQQSSSALAFWAYFAFFQVNPVGLRDRRANGSGRREGQACQRVWLVVQVMFVVGFFYWRRMQEQSRKLL